MREIISLFITIVYSMIVVTILIGAGITAATVEFWVVLPVFFFTGWALRDICSAFP